MLLRRFSVKRECMTCQGIPTLDRIHELIVALARNPIGASRVLVRLDRLQIHVCRSFHDSTPLRPRQLNLHQPWLLVLDSCFFSDNSRRLQVSHLHLVIGLLVVLLLDAVLRLNPRSRESRHHQTNLLLLAWSQIALLTMCTALGSTLVASTLKMFIQDLSSRFLECM